MQIQQSIILFDGVCNLCNGTIDFVIKHDKKKQFSIVALQSETADKLLMNFELSEKPDSVVLIHADKIYFESDAVLQIANLLNYPWKLAVLFKFIPKKIRDKIYKWIAKNRYKWFGKRDFCRIIEQGN